MMFGNESAMQSGCSASAGCSSPAVGPSLTHGSGLLDSATELFIIRSDFRSALTACEKGLERLTRADEQEQSSARYGELKAALCIVGIQALAELNQWHDVLTWVLQHYGETEQIPAKIMQMCILLYTKVSEQAEVQEAVQTWLHCSSNSSLPGYSSVAELYTLHVLLPLGQTAEAKQLLMGDVGQVAFTEEQRQTALAILKDHDAKKTNRSDPSPEPVPVEAEKKITLQGSVVRKLNAVMRLLYRGLSLAGVTAWSRFIHRTAVLLFLLYLLLVRMDPALPSAYPWILQLYRLWQQMWNAMFGPYYRASS
ncbi:peroxisome assembly protein 26 isoform X1 [Neoarius graeffei]|uniref:peroxisome assembly protein 26 isoform X1 n=1 Tax=Neoarius graeffei TaxID=443677 RepID=UPI00298BC941|nr:peroxisome assembly protein 26 isoform X1 [Neoarius graeffei]